MKELERMGLRGKLRNVKHACHAKKRKVLGSVNQLIEIAMIAGIARKEKAAPSKVPLRWSATWRRCAPR